MKHPQIRFFYPPQLTLNTSVWRQLINHSNLPLFPITEWQKKDKNDYLPVFIVDYQQRLTDPYINLHTLDEYPTPVSMIYVHTPKVVQISDIIRFGSLQGVFFCDANYHDYIKGLMAISRGELWLDRQLSSQLIHHFYSLLVRYAPPANVKLTPRETELLKALTTGVSNNKLAELFNLSEHTIKSHLYNIFRKLEVKNRNQAKQWAHHFLP